MANIIDRSSWCRLFILMCLAFTVTLIGSLGWFWQPPLKLLSPARLPYSDNRLEDNLSSGALSACEAWARRPAPLTLFRQWLGGCLVPHVGMSGRATWNRSNNEVRVPRDALEMCQWVTFLMSNGRLPKHTTDIEHGDLVLLDVGAAFGGELLIGHRLGFRVLSFEARKSEWAQLDQYWRSLPRVRIINAAVSDISGVGQLQLFNADDSSSLHRAAVSYGLEASKVKTQIATGHSFVENVTAMSLDYALKMFAPAGSKVGFIKIDVQGHEYEVLKGAFGLLQSDHPPLYFEYSPNFRGVEAPKILCFVRRLGYECVFQGNMVMCI